jgi:hypothetical protein
LLFVGDNWAEGHHDVVVQDDAGKTLARRQLPEGADGIARFHELVASCWGEHSEPDLAHRQYYTGHSRCSRFHSGNPRSEHMTTYGTGR